ncbi:MAG TPA: polyphenol oxidase family protein, partial [Propionibacteriaceae bacterium]|nr:polyphenol oxidase family protein [Propionibacteriaceae bacterium]
MFSTFLDPGASGVGVAFTDREGGVSGVALGPLNLGRTDADTIDNVRENFDLVRAHLGVPTVVTLHQVHGPDVQVVDEAFLASWGPSHHLGEPGGAPPEPVGDALVTALPGVALVVRVADCVPILFSDAAARVIGAAHAGRAGFASGVLPATCASMRGLGAGGIEAWIGPHICGACYEVPASMADDLATDHPAARATTSWGTPSI